MNREPRRHPFLSLAAIGAVAITSFLPQNSEGCMMTPKKYTGTISQNAQEAVIFHKGDREELILKVNYKIKGETTPDRFAWIITVPNEPDRYSVADQTIFKEMFRWGEQRMAVRKKGRGRGDGQDSPLQNAVPDSIELGKRVQVGPYDIQPVRAKGAQALDGLNKWLSMNGFPTEDPGHMKYFIDKGFTFLAIKINPKEGEKNVSAGGDVKPLHLSFKSEKIYYPLLFSSRQGEFGLNLYTFTDKELDYSGSAATFLDINFPHQEKHELTSNGHRKNEEVTFSTLPKSLQAQLTKTGAEGVKTQAKWNANIIRTKKTNQNQAISKWTKDIFFKKVDA